MNVMITGNQAHLMSLLDHLILWRLSCISTNDTQTVCILFITDLREMPKQHATLYLCCRRHLSLQHTRKHQNPIKSWWCIRVTEVDLFRNAYELVADHVSAEKHEDTFWYSVITVQPWWAKHTPNLEMDGLQQHKDHNCWVLMKLHFQKKTWSHLLQLLMQWR